MGSSASKPSPLAPTFQRLDSWDIKSSKRLLAEYKEKDLDFGLDAQGLAEIIGGDTTWAEAIIDAFGGTNGIVNVLAFISGAILVSSGAALEKANLVFDAMDFDMTEQISMDEMTIALLCCARGYCVMSGTGKVPSDEELENVTLQAYRELSKSGGQSITKTEFTKWVIKYIANAPTAIAQSEVTLQDMAVQFGLEIAAVKSISEEVLQELAGENNTTLSDEPVAQTTVSTEAEVDHVNHEGVQLAHESERDVAGADTLSEAQVVDGANNEVVQEHEPHADEQPQQPNDEEYNEEFQQETPRIEAHEWPIESASAIEQDEALQIAQVDGEAPVAEPERAAEEFEAAQSVEAAAIGEIAPSGSYEMPSDMNAYDTYDYTQASYDSSSGLPPPDPLEGAPDMEEEAAHDTNDASDVPAAAAPVVAPEKEGS